MTKIVSLEILKLKSEVKSENKSLKIIKIRSFY
jgi:hypothetical protein